MIISRCPALDQHLMSPKGTKRMRSPLSGRNRGGSCDQKFCGTSGGRSSFWTGPRCTVTSDLRDCTCIVGRASAAKHRQPRDAIRRGPDCTIFARSKGVHGLLNPEAVHDLFIKSRRRSCIGPWQAWQGLGRSSSTSAPCLTLLLPHDIFPTTQHVHADFVSVLHGCWKPFAAIVYHNPKSPQMITTQQAPARPST